ELLRGADEILLAGWSGNAAVGFERDGERDGVGNVGPCGQHDRTAAVVGIEEPGADGRVRRDEPELIDAPRRRLRQVRSGEDETAAAAPEDASRCRGRHRLTR